MPEQAASRKSENVELEQEIGQLLKSRRLTLAVAESCTGGLVGHKVTSVSGSSEYFRGGVVAYANEVKTDLLEVPSDVVREKGAVSDVVAGMMAAGVRKRCGADIGLGVTGIAGPGGGTPEKPVGLSYIGVSDGKSTTVRRFQFRGDRTEVKAAVGRAALETLRDFLNKEGE
jgi:PncC family amidohydrolase